MSARKLFFACTAMAAAALIELPAASADSLTLPLVSPTATDNTFNLDVSLSVGGGPSEDSDTATGAGDAVVELEHTFIDSQVVVTEIEFTGGRISFSDVSFNFFLIIDVDGTGIAATPSTVVSPSVVTDGLFAGSDHLLFVDEGVFESVIQNFNVADTPFGGPGSGQGSVELTPVSSTATSITLDTKVTLPVAFTGRIQDLADGDPATVDVTLAGSIVAAGEWVVELPLAGDYNDDGTVDAADYTVWRDNVGQPAGTLPNDLDGGAIDADQYETWAANFGATTPAPVTAAVPEPTGALLLAFAVGSVVIRRR